MTRFPFTDWENSFENVTRLVPSGYTAMLQKDIATSGDCLILVGGGSFQGHAEAMYKNKRGEKEHCLIKLNRECQ